MNNDLIKGKWREIKGEIQKAWGNVTGDELDKTQGDLTSISGIIQQKYGEKKESVSQRLNEIIGRFDAPVDRGAEDARRPVSDKMDKVKDTIRNL